MVVLALAGIVLAGVTSAVRSGPAFYSARAGETADQAAARRFLTKVVALKDVGNRPGSWGLALTEAECNAWLANDLPRNHGALLPHGLAEPRVRLVDGAIDVAARLTDTRALPAWLVRVLRPVVAVRLEVRLSGLDRAECRITAARAGMIPLPPGPMLHVLAGRLRNHGFACETPRVDGHTILVVTLPSGEPGNPAVRVTALSIGSGELLVAGTTAER